MKQIVLHTYMIPPESNFQGYLNEILLGDRLPQQHGALTAVLFLHQKMTLQKQEEI